MTYIKLVEYLIDTIIGKTNSTKVEITEEDRLVNIFITVDPKDIGKVIGKNGNIITAIRHIASAAATRNQQRLYIKILSLEDSVTS